MPQFEDCNFCHLFEYVQKWQRLLNPCIKAQLEYRRYVQFGSVLLSHFLSLSSLSVGNYCLLPYLSNVIVVHWRGRPSIFGVVFNGRSARFEKLVPLVTLRTAQTILSISLLQHLKSLRKSFSQFETEFDANALLLKILHFSTYKK